MTSLILINSLLNKRLFNTTNYTFDTDSTCIIYSLGRMTKICIDLSMYTGIKDDGTLFFTSKRMVSDNELRTMNTKLLSSSGNPVYVNLKEFIVIDRDNFRYYIPKRSTLTIGNIIECTHVKYPHLVMDLIKCTDVKQVKWPDHILSLSFLNQVKRAIELAKVISLRKHNNSDINVDDL